MENRQTQLSSPVSTRTLTQSALLIGVATALSYFKLGQWPYGGSVTLGSMIPIMLISVKYPFSWSMLTAVAYSLIQMIQEFYAPPVANMQNYILMIALDYVIAFGVLCLAGPIYKALNKNISERVSIMSAAIVCFILRFLCHYASGIIIWDVYAPEGQPVWMYSLLYNGPYMLAECIISGAILFIAGKQLLSILKEDNS